MGFNEDDFLMISGIQHFAFCRRQWALIHIEQQWEDNVLTIEGQDLHKKADQPFIREKRGDKLIVRAMPVQSYTLGITGICDVVEFIKDPEGIVIKQSEETYRVYPVEYKRGKPKWDDSDTMQLLAQAMLPQVQKGERNACDELPKNVWIMGNGCKNLCLSAFVMPRLWPN